MFKRISRIIKNISWKTHRSRWLHNNYGQSKAEISGNWLLTSPYLQRWKGQMYLNKSAVFSCRFLYVCMTFQLLYITGTYWNKKKHWYEINQFKPPFTLKEWNSISMYSLSNERCTRWKVCCSGFVDLFACLPNLTSSRSNEKWGWCVVSPSII